MTNARRATGMTTEPLTTTQILKNTIISRRTLMPITKLITTPIRAAARTTITTTTTTIIATTITAKNNNNNNNNNNNKTKEK